MRNAFAAAITELAARDPRVILLSGDIGNRLFDQYKENLPDRFYNCGVSEANMTGMAAGMADSHHVCADQAESLLKQSLGSTAIPTEAKQICLISLVVRHSGFPSHCNADACCAATKPCAASG